MIRRLALSICIAVVAGSAISLPAFAQPSKHQKLTVVSNSARLNVSATQVLLAAINAMRAKKHLPLYVSNAKLSACALKHSTAMANTGKDGTLFHNLSGDACIKFSAAGENIGYASGLPATAVITTFTEMMAEGPCPKKCPPSSPLWEKHGHYINLTSTTYTTIGIGVYTKYYSDLKMTLTWVTEDFVTPA